MSRRYAILDVFTDKPLAGNPLAVVLDATRLDSAAMQAIAREFNLSETVFVVPPASSRHSASIRIFTPAQELPFAGHPTVGTAVLLAMKAAGEKGAVDDRVIVLEEKVGIIRCAVSLRGQGVGHAVFDMPRGATRIDFSFDVEAVAEAVGITPAEVGFENHQPTAFTAGVPYAFVPVRDLDVLARAKPHAGHWARAFPALAGSGAFVYTRENPSHRTFRARMFALELGIVEDPATGGAVAALVGVIRQFDGPPAGSHHFLIEQGFEMGRPSLIKLEIDIDGGEVTGARIGGDAMVVAEGELEVG